jgi:hypothetical protein
VFLSLEDAAASGICPNLPGAVSPVVTSSAMPTVTLATTAMQTGHSVLPAATKPDGETVSAMPVSAHLGDAASSMASQTVVNPGPVGAQPTHGKPIVCLVSRHCLIRINALLR